MPMDGVFQELVIEPTKIEESQSGKTTWISDASGKRIEITKKGARSSLYLYLRGMHNLPRPEIWALSPAKREKTMNTALEAFRAVDEPRVFKLILTDEGKVDAVVTTQHKQVSYSTVQTAVEEAIKLVIPNAQFYDRGLDRYFTYSLPIESKYVNSWVGIDAGVNKPKGRCAIYVYTRMEVVWKGQDGSRTPCKNWAFWERPGRFFGIDINRLTPVPHLDKVGNLSTKTVHVQGTSVDVNGLAEAIKKIIETGSSIDPIIEDAMNVNLHSEEIQAILEAYQETVGLPDYAVKAIAENVIDLDLWGLSNAVSWFRTHGELRASKTENREARSIIFTLENISGELLTLGPIIRELKRRIPDGKLTKDILLNPSEDIFGMKLESEATKQTTQADGNETPKQDEKE